MKPTELTRKWKNHFWTLFTGGCWHEKDLDIALPSDTIFMCKHCKKFIEPTINYYSDLSGFQRVKDFMEKEMPEEWNQYLYETHGNVWLSTKGWKRYDVILNAMLDLDNLLSFLLSNTEMWGWKECKKPCCTECIPQDGNCILDKNVYKVKHPALLFAEGLE